MEIERFEWWNNGDRPKPGEVWITHTDEVVIVNACGSYVTYLSHSEKNPCGTHTTLYHNQMARRFQNPKLVEVEREEEDEED